MTDKKFFKNKELLTISCLPPFFLRYLKVPDKRHRFWYGLRIALRLLCFLFLFNVTTLRAENWETAVVMVNRFVFPPFASYALMVYADRNVELWGLNPDVRKQFTISQAQYDQIIKLVNGLSLYVEKEGIRDSVGHEPALVTYRTNIARVHRFSDIDAAYARFFLDFEAILKLQNFICPRRDFIDGEMSEFGCENEAQKLNAILKERKQ